MSSYHIIDEPKTRTADYLIVNPIIILLAAMFVPLVWTPPLLGKFWLPLLWVGMNSYLLGSPTFKKELAIMVGGTVLFIMVIIATEFIRQAFTPILKSSQTAPYLRIALQAVFFATLYFVVFLQAAPHAIYEYIKEQATKV
ncbi:hypothetical protein FK216_09930 [Moraxellaceae bacterium AER2_44_116]|nr:hypothetical protein [Moraxellaceae bacterium]TQC97204.1 hypothetical protein FK216_09930 [Moraxellaceae bacterium AER2_44_116]